LVWIAFVTFVLFLLALDLGVFHRKARVVTVREALVTSAGWIALALVFNAFVYFAYEYHWFGLDLPSGEPDGRTAAVLFLTGYMAEKSLGMDNVFVIAMIFSSFGIPAKHQHRVLFWGIVGALVMRAAMILAGAALIERFHWILYVFGIFLIVTGVRMILARHAPDPERQRAVVLARRVLPVTPRLHGERLVVRVDGRLAIESADVMFAVDSIPAVFAITQEPFLAFTSNIMAVLGLRSLYFALAGLIHRFRYLKVSLALLLVLVGVKILLQDILETVPGTTFYALGAIALVLAGGIISSIVWAPRTPESRRVEVPARRGLLARR